MNTKILFLPSVIFLSAAIMLFNSGCGKKDDPVAPKEEHFKAIGMVFYTSGIKVASILRGVTSDTFKVAEGVLGPGIDVKFYNENEQEINPPAGDYKLAWEFTPANQNIVEVWQHPGEEGDFEFHLRGLNDGMVEIEFFVMHEGHADYRSDKMPVKVEHGPTVGEPVGFKLYDEDTGNLLLTYNADGSITGSITVALNDTTDHIEVKFFDESGNEFQPPVPAHSLLLEIADTLIAGITGLDPAEPWAFKIIGLTTGSTTLTLKIMHGSEIEKSFTGIPINVQ